MATSAYQGERTAVTDLVTRARAVFAGTSQRIKRKESTQPHVNTIVAPSIKQLSRQELADILTQQRIPKAPWYSDIPHILDRATNFIPETIANYVTGLLPTHKPAKRRVDSDEPFDMVIVGRPNYQPPVSRQPVAKPTPRFESLKQKTKTWAQEQAKTIRASIGTWRDAQTKYFDRPTLAEELAADIRVASNRTAYGMGVVAAWTSYTLFTTEGAKPFKQAVQSRGKAIKQAIAYHKPTQRSSTTVWSVSEAPAEPTKKPTLAFTHVASEPIVYTGREKEQFQRTLHERNAAEAATAEKRRQATLPVPVNTQPAYATSDLASIIAIMAPNSARPTQSAPLLLLTAGTNNEQKKPAYSSPALEEAIHLYTARAWQTEEWQKNGHVAGSKKSGSAHAYNVSDILRKTGVKRHDLINALREQGMLTRTELSVAEHGLTGEERYAHLRAGKENVVRAADSHHKQLRETAVYLHRTLLSSLDKEDITEQKWEKDFNEGMNNIAKTLGTTITKVRTYIKQESDLRPQNRYQRQTPVRHASIVYA